MFTNKQIIKLTVAAFILITSTTAIAQMWTSLNGPQIAKNVKDISLSGDVIYIAENDYLLKSTNGGTAWQATPSTVSGSLVTHCKPDNANIVMASGINFFKRSVDGGVNWTNVTNVSANLTPLRLSASPVNTSNMFLGRKYDGTTSPVWRSNYSGALWEQCYNFGPQPGTYYQTDIYDIAPYPVLDNNEPARSSWLWVAGSTPSGQQKSPRSTSAVASMSGIWWSPNSGTTWFPRTMGDYNIRSIAVIHKPSPNNPHIYAVAEGIDTVYKTIDLGNTWPESLRKKITGASSIRMIRVNNTNNYIFLATDNGVYRSTDEGATYTQQNNGLGTDLNVLSIAVSGSNTVFAGTANSLYKSTDNGKTWTDIRKMKVSKDFKNKTSRVKK